MGKSFKYGFPYFAFILIAIFLFYLIFETGLHGDDYSVIKNQNVSDFFSFTPESLGLAIFGVPTYLTFWWAYPVLGYEHQLAYDLVKWITHLAGVFMAWRFFSVFISSQRALAAALFFMLLPLHETTTYWYMTASYVFWPAVIMFSYYLFFIDKIKSGLVVGLLGAFSGYLSPPYVFGLGLIWFFRRQYRKGFLFISPGLLYVFYYFSIKYFYPFAEKRIKSDLDLTLFAKGILMQVAGTLDSFLGPSAFIKLYYSAASITLSSLFIATIILFIALRFVEGRTFIADDARNLIGLKPLLIGALSVLLLSLVMFSLTGMYVPSPFNLGNRSLVFGSLLVSILLASMPINRKNILILWLIFVLPVLGLSDHWKAWNQEQKHVLKNISRHHGLRAVSETDLLIVTGHIYSRLGPYSHVEFFNMPWVTRSIFKDFALVKNVVALTQTLNFDNSGELIDSKSGERYSLNRSIYIYDSENNSLTSSTIQDVSRLVMNRPREIRHWVQLTKGTFLESAIVALSPRLNYLFVN
jgi:hypothetical protein